MSKIVSPPIRLLIVEETEDFRTIIENFFQDDPSIDLVGFAVNGVDALRKRKEVDPEVIIMNASLSEMDGLTTLPQLLKLDPYLRVIMLFSPDEDNSEASAEAMVLGAADVIIKPKHGGEIELFRKDLEEKIHILGESRREHIPPTISDKSSGSIGEKIAESHQSTVEAAQRISKDLLAIPRVLAIGSSTGGPQALTTMFKQLKDNLPDIPILITQHMPANFTNYLSVHIQEACGRTCKEAEDGELLRNDTIYVAPGDYHMIVKKEGEKITLSLNQDPPENFCRPAVDPMFRSLVKVYGSKILAVILTGMGKDGLEGAKLIAQEGGEIVAQDEHSCVVWGMPKAVAEAGICDEILPLDAIAHHIIMRCK